MRILHTRPGRLGATLAAAAAALAVAAGPASASSYPVNWSAVTGNASGALANVAPAGANNWSCKPSAAHPDPVVLLHGVFENQNMAWQALAPTLANDGFCVFTATYGQTWYSGNLGGFDDVTTSAAQVDGFVGKVLSATGSAKVDIVGYSEGSFVGRLYMHDYGSAHVDRFVGIAGVNSQPANISGILTLAYQIPGAAAVVGIACPACNELSTQPAFTSLNNPPTYPNVTYTLLGSSSDEVATPYQLAFLPAASNVTDITIQSLCPSDPVGHLGMPYDKTSVQLTLNALDPSHPGAVPCGAGFSL